MTRTFNTGEKALHKYTRRVCKVVNSKTHVTINGYETYFVEYRNGERFYTPKVCFKDIPKKKKSV